MRQHYLGPRGFGCSAKDTNPRDIFDITRVSALIKSP